MRATRVLAVTATVCAAMAFSAPLACADDGPVSTDSGQVGSGHDQAAADSGQAGTDGEQGREGRDDQGQGRGDGGRDDHQQGRGDGGHGRTDAASGPSHVRVDPYRVHQGGKIRITVDGCTRGGSVTSNAFPKTRLSVSPSGHASATARIYDRATPGTYNLAVRCNGGNRVATQQFSVVSGRGALGGLGGSVAPSSTETAVGAGLVATAAVGGTLFVVRRRRTLGAF